MCEMTSDTEVAFEIVMIEMVTTHTVSLGLISLMVLKVQLSE
jgi:hypothetical protein